MRLLQDKGVLLRNYTQNIDGLERCEATLHTLYHYIYSFPVTCIVEKICPLTHYEVYAVQESCLEWSVYEVLRDVMKHLDYMTLFSFGLL